MVLEDWRCACICSHSCSMQPVIQQSFQSIACRHIWHVKILDVLSSHFVCVLTCKVISSCRTICAADVRRPMGRPRWKGMVRVTIAWIRWHDDCRWILKVLVARSCGCSPWRGWSVCIGCVRCRSSMSGRPKSCRRGLLHRPSGAQPVVAATAGAATEVP